MNFWQGKICPVCRQQFQETDDIVYCPECGTAHHRECWKSVGGCFFAPEHQKGNFDTTNEVHAAPPPSSAAHTDQKGTRICPECGASCRQDLRVCLHCGHEFDTQSVPIDPVPNAETQNNPTNNYPPPPGGYGAGSFPPFGAFAGYGPIPEEQPDTSEVIIGNVTQQDLVRYCGPDGAKYAENFKAVRDKKKTFCFAGFFGSCFWLLYRKMIAAGLIAAGIVSSPLIASVILIFTNYRADLVQAAASGNPEQLYAIFDQAVAEITALPILSAVFWIVLLLVMLFCGFFGHRLYFRKAEKDITAIKENVSAGMERNYYYARRGGISVIYPFLAIFLFYGLLNLLLLFLI